MILYIFLHKCAVRLLGKMCVYFVFSFDNYFSIFHLRYRRYTAK